MFETIIVSLLAAGIFAGGFFTRDCMKKEVVINNIENRTEVLNNNDTRQVNGQTQITIVSALTNINVDVTDFTNISITKSSISNKTSVTN